MMNLDSARSLYSTAVESSREGITLAMANTKLRETYTVLKAEVDSLSSEIEVGCDTLNTMVKAAKILSSVSEECTNQVLNAITDVINKALQVLFPDDPKTIEIVHTVYRDTHPQYTLILRTQNGVPRAFNQSGTGLAQVISFLFTTCLIDARKGRNIMVMDELLSGLHPDAKGIVRDIMLALSTRKNDPFQFIIVEYGVDVGKQYEVCKSGDPRGLSTVHPWSEVSSTGYYQTKALKD